MAATVLFEIKKKSRSPSTKKSPFPLVFHLGTDKSNIVTWQIYRGVLKPDGVVVTSQEDMKNLYHMGYFGKGTLSRSAPRFNADCSAEDPIEERAMSFHRYQRHKQLREKAEAEGTLDSNRNLDPPKVILVKLPDADKKESSNDVTVISETGLRRPVPRILARAKNSKCRDREGGGTAETHDCPYEGEENASNGKVGNNEGSDNGTTSEKICSIDEGSDQEAAGEGTGSAKAADEGPDIFECDSSGEKITESGEDCAESSSVEPQNDDDGSNDIIEVDSQTGTDVVGEDDKSTAAEESLDKKAGGDEADVTEEACASEVDKRESETGGSPEQASVTDQQDDEESKPLEIDLSAPETGSENSVKMEAPDEQKDSKAELLEINLALSATSTGGAKQVSSPSKEKRKRWHAVEEEGTVASDGDEVEMIHSGASEEPEVFSAEDPWPITESLQLFFEEAYFLSYGLGCLIVKDGDEDLELLKLWQRLCGLRDNFPARYAAYHHFRSKGWVVRSGAKFAADYLLYKDGPPFYHASFSVIVRTVWADTLEENPDHRLQSWPTLSGLIRVNGNASKAVLLCHVIMPRGADFTTPHVLRSFKIQELLVRRWIVSEEREKRDDVS
ncbi:tRNA splicing endonuclease subunit 2 [Dermacentor variabilis]|uniref:tRNA splicing endonuclease subunit 2 n=1 Tax=Dermacentor variabilis TaxID=34621 RepID=UPI003F5B643E